jgi:hypothetical protein
MSASTAIGRVSESLRNLLLSEMQLTPAVPVTILAPDEPGGARRVNLFLYKVEENPFLRNEGWQPNPTDTTKLLAPPLALNLRYLLTAYANNDANLGNAPIHEILGDAMRVFYQHPIVPNAHLAGDLGAAREQIKITPNGIDMEELSQVWGTFSQPFRLSVLYEVSVVQLDQSDDTQRSMPKRVREIGVPEVRAPYVPPIVDRVDPISDQAGSTVTFFGAHLDGWSASVSVLGTTILDGAAISGDSFQAALPATLQPGFYQLRVDVSHLFRRIFNFEVTP